jgi:hypothetical protein
MLTLSICTIVHKEARIGFGLLGRGCVLIRGTSQHLAEGSEEIHDLRNKK